MVVVEVQQKPVVVVPGTVVHSAVGTSGSMHAALALFMLYVVVAEMIARRRRGEVKLGKRELC